MTVSPGDSIGILGAGQLGRMLALAAARLGLRVEAYAPESGPAFDVCAGRTIALYDDEEALTSFAAKCAVVTYEFENVPARALEILGAAVPVRPGVEALRRTQDRLLEKQFLQSLGVKTAPFAAVEDAGGLARAVAQMGRPCILKTRRFGYDGKGQVLIGEGVDLAAAFGSLAGHPAILEGFVRFAREVSVIAARGLEGEFVAYDLCENLHENHVLATTRAPAAVRAETSRNALWIARAIADALDYVGVLAVEMFVVEDEAGGEALLVNELAPRVHNSGHWTIDGAATSQFEQHVRAICGWPLGSCRRLGAVEMRNLLGQEVLQWRSLLADPEIHLHLYGKNEARPGRKMGHATRVAPARDLDVGQAGSIGRKT